MPTWFNTLDLKPDVSLGSIWKMVDYAKALGYPYFVWNHVVYSTQVTDKDGMTMGATPFYKDGDQIKSA